MKKTTDNNDGSTNDMDRPKNEIITAPCRDETREGTVVVFPFKLKFRMRWSDIPSFFGLFRRGK